nr:HAD family acid phosphatase [Bacillus sp. SRB3LM]
MHNETHFENKYSSNTVFFFSYGISVTTNTAETNIFINRTTVMADAWYQTAGEVKTLYHQGYTIGKMKLDMALAKGTEKKPAIVLDLDETVVDNSPYQAMTVKTGKGYPL